MKEADLIFTFALTAGLREWASMALKIEGVKYRAVNEPPIHSRELRSAMNIII